MRVFVFVNGEPDVRDQRVNFLLLARGVAAFKVIENVEVFFGGEHVK